MIAVLAGGVGAARLLLGLLEVVEPAAVVAIVNTGDDTNLHGLHISPDLDTITYTVAGASNLETGWGLAGESWTVMDALERFGAPTWFRLGDRDIATHLHRTGRLAAGATLSEVSREVAAAFGLPIALLPMSDDPVRTRLELVEGGEVDFQEYFVRLRHAVAVRSIRYAGAPEARPAPGVLEALRDARRVVIAPSNPLLSIGPILALPGVAQVLAARRDRVVAISPIVAGAAIKGPADRLLAELGHEPSALGVARLLAPYAGAFVADERDAALAPAIGALGLRCALTDTLMATPGVAASLARAALDAASSTE